MIRVGVIGATGYAGAELVRILSDHPEVELTILTSRQYAGVPFSDIYPAMAGIVELTCEAYSVGTVCDKTDAVFTALPHKLPMGIVPEILENDKRVIDLSADFRFQNLDIYEAFYQPHTAPEINREAVYGLAEIHFQEIQTARLVGNPGCYPTSVLLPLVPLLRERLICTEMIIADSKSGVSGAGRSLSLATHYCEVNESFKAYKVASHRHTPEMEESLSTAAGKAIQLTFVPHLVPLTRGMLTTCYSILESGVDEAAVRRCLHDYYNDRPFVRICPQGKMPGMSHVRGTNYCDIGLAVEKKTGRLILVSAIDNLVKGAAGQAVQNLNLMYGFHEKAGLDNTPYPL